MIKMMMMVAAFVEKEIDEDEDREERGGVVEVGW